jgi:hypothetical protein
MSTVINQPGIAKQSGDTLEERARLLTNEASRALRRLRKVQKQIAGLAALKDVLPRYLQPGDYEFIREHLQHEAKRWQEEYDNVAWHASDARHDAKRGEAGCAERQRQQIEADLPAHWPPFYRAPPRP